MTLLSHEDYYREMSTGCNLVGEWNYVAELQDYYGMAYLNIIPVPVWWGRRLWPHVEREDRIDIYSILISFDKESREMFIYGNEAIFKLLLRHEFSYSFVNRITDIPRGGHEVSTPVGPTWEEMDALNYGSWLLP